MAFSYPPPPPLHSNRLGATVSSHPRGNTPQVTVPSPPGYYAKDTRQETSHADTRAYEPQHDPGTAKWDVCSALLKYRLCVPLFLAGVFDSEELHMLLQAWLPHGQQVWLHSWLRVWHKVWQLREQAWQGAPAPVASTILAGTILPPERWKSTTAPASWVCVNMINICG